MEFNPRAKLDTSQIRDIRKPLKRSNYVFNRKKEHKRNVERKQAIIRRMRQTRAMKERKGI